MKFKYPSQIPLLLLLARNIVVQYYCSTTIQKTEAL